MAFATQQALIRKEQEDEHLAFIAHDLRTPLNAVSLVAEELRLGLDEKALAGAGELFEIRQRSRASMTWRASAQSQHSKSLKSRSA